jgi:hypothetical protein
MKLLTGGARSSAVWGEGGVTVRLEAQVGRGLDWRLGRFVPLRPFSFSLFLFPFLFLIFGLFNIFCIIHSNQFNPLSEIF